MMYRFTQILLICLLVYYLFHGLSFQKINFSIFYLSGIVWTLISIVVSQIIVAKRWQFLSKLSFKISYETIVISTLFNVILPAKLGELTKALYLKKYYNYNYHKALSIIFVERFFDVIMMLLLICIWAYDFFSNELIKNSIVMLIFFIFITILFFNTKGMLKFLKKIPIQFLRIYTQKIYKNINLLLKSSLNVFFSTLLIWIFYLISNILFFKYAVHFGLSYNNILELFIISSIAFTIPLTPAGIGVFEGAVVITLTAHGIAKEDALMSATIYHTILLLVDFILFYPVFLTKDIRFREFYS